MSNSISAYLTSIDFAKIGKDLLEKGAVNGLEKAAEWLKTDGASKAEEMINGLNISDSSKTKMIDIIRDFTGTDGSGASSDRPPVTGTPYEEGNLARSYDEMLAQLKRMQTEANLSLAEGGGKKASGSKGEKFGSQGLSDDFFIALATAMGNALQTQAETVRTQANALDAQITKHGEDNKARLEGRGENGLTETGKLLNQQESDQIMMAQTLLSAESMKLNFLATGFQTALKAVGDSLSTMGRG